MTTPRTDIVEDGSPNASLGDLKIVIISRRPIGNLGLESPKLRADLLTEFAEPVVLADPATSSPHF
jgi:hypothetical protein